MSKLKVSTREIGSVRVFDLQGEPTQETLQEVAWKIQRNIRRYRIQRIILNLQMIHTLEPLGLRKLLAACIRPQRSLIFGASKPVVDLLEGTYLPRNVRICSSEKEIAEDFGPFLMEKESSKEILSEEASKLKNVLSAGDNLDRRRSKRMHVALPIRVKILVEGGLAIESPAIATNISENGMFAEYLDLEAALEIDALDPIKQTKVEVTVFPSENFPEEYHVEGFIRRKELRKKQLGIGIQFAENKECL